MSAVPWADCIIHLEGVTPPFVNPCLARGRWSYRPEGANFHAGGWPSCPWTPPPTPPLLGSTPNIAKYSQKLYPLLTCRAHPFEEARDWLKFSYTLYRTGAYLVPLSTVIGQSVALEGDNIFYLIWRQLLQSYPRAYITSTYRITPLGLINTIISQLVWRLWSGKLTQAGREEKQVFITYITQLK